MAEEDHFERGQRVVINHHFAFERSEKLAKAWVGMEGTISAKDADAVFVSTANGRCRWFEKSHVSLLPHTVIPEPEFDLEDMELAEIIMEELK